MKALTVRQPWASLIVHGPKWIETRTRATNIRGRIGIIAGKWKPRARDWETCDDINHLWYRATTHYDANGDLTSEDWPMPRGALIGTVEVYDCVPIELVLPAADRAPGTRAYRSDHDRVTVHPLARADKSYIWTAGVGRCADDQLPYGDFTPGRWAWLLRDPLPCDPVPMRGALGWQEVEAP